MKLTKNIRQYIKIALSAGLLAFPSCSYLGCHTTGTAGIL